MEEAVRCYCQCHRGPLEFHYSLMKEKQYYVCVFVCVCQGGQEELCFKWCNLTETGQMSFKIFLFFFTQCSAVCRLCGINKTLKQPPQRTHSCAPISLLLFPSRLKLKFSPSFTPTEPTHTSLTRPQLHITRLVSFQMRTCIFALWREIFSRCFVVSESVWEHTLSELWVVGGKQMWIEISPCSFALP